MKLRNKHDRVILIIMALCFVGVLTVTILLATFISYLLGGI